MVEDEDVQERGRRMGREFKTEKEIGSVDDRLNISKAWGRVEACCEGEEERIEGGIVGKKGTECGLCWPLRHCLPNLHPLIKK